MKKSIMLTAMVALIAASVGFVGGKELPVEQDAGNYMVLVEFTMDASQSFADALESMNTFGKSAQSIGLNVRTFMHEWGPSNSFYMTIETESWEEIGSVFERMVEAMPELMNEPFGFSGHSDIIMRELPIQ